MDLTDRLHQLKEYDVLISIVMPNKNNLINEHNNKQKITGNIFERYADGNVEMCDENYSKTHSCDGEDEIVKILETEFGKRFAKKILKEKNGEIGVEKHLLVDFKNNVIYEFEYPSCYYYQRYKEYMMK